ncbi:MAG: hypothetical protein H7Y88_00690, partial [Phycisphaerales bacterium]|nr:hypothetical protein [Phycisphaerales bacterium]
AQELRVDPRVQYAPHLTVTDEALVRDSLKLADAIASGKADELRSLMTPGAKAVLASLESTGQWDEGTGGVEAVRIVYAGTTRAAVIDEGEEEGEGGEGEEAPEGPPDIAAVLEAVAKGEPIPGVPEEMGKTMSDAMKKQFEAMGQTLTPENVAIMIETLRSSGMLDTIQKQLDTSFALLGGAGAGGGYKGPKGMMAVLLAVQDSDGAYLLGWGVDRAGDGWVFNNEPTVGEVKRRASEWDRVGLKGFGIAASAGEFSASASATPKPEGDTPPTPEGEPAPEPEEKKDGPIRKNTPGGPITIPDPNGPK